MSTSLASLSLRTLLAGCLVAATLHAAHAQAPIIVDDNGGPGVHFTEISDALAAAPDFAVVLVRPGLYTGPLTISRSVRLQADPGVLLSPNATIRIDQVPSGLPVAVQGFTSTTFQARDCDATVVLDSESTCNVQLVNGCADLRTRHVRVASILSSKVEVVGMPGSSSGSIVDGGSFVHFVDSEILGYIGDSCHVPVCWPEDGGTALHVRDSEVVLTRTSVVGGAGGYSFHPNLFSSNGPGIVAVNSALRLSECTVEPGNNTVAYAAQAFILIGSSATDVTSTPDPSLRVTGSLTPGGASEFVLRGAPGDYIRLSFGRRPVSVSVPGSPIDRLTSADRVGALGPMPASGEIRIPFTVPATYPPGTLWYLQMSAVDPTGVGRYSNSSPVFVLQ